MNVNELFDAIHNADSDRLGRLLALPEASGWLEARDDSGFTPLAVAVGKRPADAALVERLLRAGSAVDAQVDRYGQSLPILSLAISGGDPATVRVLLDAGADLHYRHEGYGALLDAVHGRDVRGDGRLLELLSVLVARGAALDDVSPHGESAIRVLSRLGRFDAVAALLEAGASDAPLQWTPLMRTVALGAVSEIPAALAREADPEARDSWSRSAWHIAVLSGDVERADALRAGGADTTATGHCASTSLHYAVDSGDALMLDYLLAYGADVNAVDQFGHSAVFRAAETGKLTSLQALIEAGADSAVRRSGMGPEELLKLLGRDVPPGLSTEQAAPIELLADVTDPKVAAYLLDQGADPACLSFEARRGLVGLPPEPSGRLLQVSADEYAAQRDRRFGETNPQAMAHPFWLDMIRSGVTGYEAKVKLARDDDGAETPVWCAQRFGQSHTFLPDGRKVQIGGEHEDSYDPDFCIYNDVFVHAPDGGIHIYGYPHTVFPPTDFHAATRVGSDIYVIGSLGYAGTRTAGFTPVFVLDTQTFVMRRIDTQGEMPGWIYKHRTIVGSENVLIVRGGKIVRNIGGEEIHAANPHEYQLDLTTRIWRRIG